MITTVAELEALYGTPSAVAETKVAREITPSYRRFIEAAPFVALATAGPEGTDCSPRGDNGQVVFVVDNQTLALPDWHGNNRLDSLRNVVRDGRVSLMFLVPGSDIIVRVNGTGTISADAEMLAQYTKHGKTPRTVLLVQISELYFQCSRAVIRAGLWQGETPPALPSIGDIMAEMTSGEFDGETFDKAWPERARKNLW